MTVALFVTCLADTLYPAVGSATVRLLERLGGVEFPRAQTCCGQLHLNAGYPDVAATLARQFVEVFDGREAVVSPSGSCVAHVRAHVPELTVDSGGVAARTWELSEFLVDRLEVTGWARGSWARSPTTRPVTHFGCWRWGSGRSPCCGRCPVSTCVRSTRRRSAAASADVRDQERAGLLGDAGRQAAAGGGDGGQRGVRVRRIVPVAHPRWAGAAGSAVRAVHLAEVLAS